MVDSIKIYGKTKDSFGWPEESEENVPTGTSGSAQPISTTTEVEQSSTETAQITKLEK